LQPERLDLSPQLREFYYTIYAFVKNLKSFNN